MPLEEDIVAWSATRPAWQRSILKRIAKGDLPSDSDYGDLVEDLVTGTTLEDVTFGLEELPQAAPGDAPVSLVSITEMEHVNALDSSEPLTVEPTGITLIYGNNGSGKSGYARVLRRISRARKQEAILTDVFRDTSVAKPKATLKVRVGSQQKDVAWPDEVAAELQRMLFYDEVCGAAYISSESEFPYRPSALFVMDGLIQACDEVGSRVDARIDANEKRAKATPDVDPDVADSEVGKFLVELSEKSKTEVLDELLAGSDLNDAVLEAAKLEEARLKSADLTKERQKLERQAEKLEAVAKHLKALDSAVGGTANETRKTELRALKSLEQAAELLAQELAAEPVSGAGSSPWKLLWEAARRFSQEAAYPDAAFPNVADGANCVLCHQELGPDATDRLKKFEKFVQDDTQTRLQTAKEAWDERIIETQRLKVIPEAVSGDLKDLEAEYGELVTEVRALLEGWKSQHTSLLDALEQRKDLSAAAASNTEVLAKLDAAAFAARAAREDLADPVRAQARLAEATKRRKEVELLRKVRDEKAKILAEITRRTELARLRKAKSEAATTGISRKATDLSAEHITEVVRDAFTRETDRLRLERVTIAKIKSMKGTVLHQPKLVGAKQSVKLPQVFSEGEKTALGLAAFFTEAVLDESKSTLVLDDPVSSLDHQRRELVAARIADLAQDRQVVVFTHDVALVSDLRVEAERRGVLMAPRSVNRSRGRDKRPGLCSAKLPWKAKDAAQRIQGLRQEAAAIRRECGEWTEEDYEDKTASWAGRLSETWERIFSQEVVGELLAEGGVEVRPNMVKVLEHFSARDNQEFQASYRRVSGWLKRHDKSDLVNYVAPEPERLEEELDFVKAWLDRVKAYKNKK